MLCGGISAAVWACICEEDEDGGTEKEEDLGGEGGQEDIEIFESPNSCSDIEADSITETKDGRGDTDFPPVSIPVSASSSINTGDVSPDELGVEPKSFQGSNGSPAPTFPLRT